MRRKVVKYGGGLVMQRALTLKSRYCARIAPREGSGLYGQGYCECNEFGFSGAVSTRVLLV